MERRFIAAPVNPCHDRVLLLNETTTGSAPDMARKFFIPVFILCLYFLPVTASAETEDKAQIGTIIEIEGTGTLLSADAGSYNKSLMSVELSAEKFNLPVYMNDTIETGADSKAHILFIDDTEITLGENASLTIDEYIFDPEYTSQCRPLCHYQRHIFIHKRPFEQKRTARCAG